jgi:hypothetical protein
LLKLPEATPVTPPIIMLAIIGLMAPPEKAVNAAPPIMGKRLDKKPASGRPV